MAKEDSRNEAEPSRLHRAALVSATPVVVEALLTQGADANERDEKGRTALHIAAAFNETPGIVDALVKAGADVNAPDSVESTPLHAAARYAPAVEIVNELLAAGAKPKACDTYGRTPYTSRRKAKDPSWWKRCSPAGRRPMRATNTAARRCTSPQGPDTPSPHFWK